MDTLFRVIGYLSVPIVLVGVALAIRSTLRERTLRGRALLLIAAIGVVYLVVHDLLRGDEVWRPLGWLLAGVGTAVGASWPERSRLRSVGGQVLEKRAAWYLALWSLAVIVSQLAALGALGEGQWPGIYATYLTTGLIPGTNLALWVRLSLLQRRDERSAPFCPHCGGAVGLRHCESCGRQVLMHVPVAG